MFHHHIFVVDGGLELFYNAKVILQSEDGNWKMVFDYKQTWVFQFPTILKIGGSIFKSENGALKRGALSIFDCHNKSMDSYWIEIE